ncbi:MAG: DUF4012 domain-containing protein [Patescibacteria group bacterium]
MNKSSTKLKSSNQSHYINGKLSNEVILDKSVKKLPARVNNKITGLNNLSQHILNLRSDLIKQDFTNKIISEQASFTNLKKITSVNFINPQDRSSLVPWWKLEQRFSILKEMTLIFVLELIYLLFYNIVKIVGRFYYRIYISLQQIGLSIVQDLVYYFELNWKVVSNLVTPWKIFRKNYERKMLFLIPRFGQVIIFILIALVLILPLKWITLQQTFALKKNQLLSFAYAAFDQFNAGGMKLGAGDFLDAGNDFNQATESVINAQKLLNSINDELADLPSKLPVSSARMTAFNNLLSASKEISDSGIILSNTLVKINFDAADVNRMNLAEKILLLQQGINQIKPKIDQALNLLQSVNQDYFSEDIKDNIIVFRSQLQNIKSIFADVLQLPNVLGKIFPQAGNYRYALIFQNYSELRATGGFLGSLAIVEVEDGKIKDINIPGGGPYDFQGQLKAKIIPPEPLRIVNSLWQLQDANWFFDFPTSAKKILWFFDKSTNLEFDGIIAINPDVVIKLLELTGPVDLEQYQKHITAQNFIRETQEAVDVEYDKITNRPKQFIADLAPMLIDKIFKLNTIDQLRVLDILKNSLRERSVQMYFTDPGLEQEITNKNWGGAVKANQDDYLAIVRNNVGGGKSDLVISEQVNHRVEVLPTGELEDTVILTRTHQGDPLDIFYKRRNLSWLKFYVPKGSQLIEAKGFSDMPVDDYRTVPIDAVEDVDLKANEVVTAVDVYSSTLITEEFNKTVFSNWLSLNPGESKTIELKYKLPFNLQNKGKLQDLKPYYIYFQKQSGTQPIAFTSNLILPPHYRIRWYESSDQLKLTTEGLELLNNWQSDIFFGAIIGDVE